jgi:hypothetical protein
MRTWTNTRTDEKRRKKITNLGQVSLYEMKKIKISTEALSQLLHGSSIAWRKGHWGSFWALWQKRHWFYFQAVHSIPYSACQFCRLGRDLPKANKRPRIHRSYWAY